MIHRTPTSFVLALVMLLAGSLPAPAQEAVVHWQFRSERVADDKLVAARGKVALPWTAERQLVSEPSAWLVQAPLLWGDGAAVLPKKRLSVAAWVRVDAFPTWQGIFSALEDNGGFEQGLLLGLSGTRFCLAVAARDSGDADGVMTYLSARTFAQPGTWTLVCGTYDGTRMQLYVDGELVGESTAQRGEVWYPEQPKVALGAYVDRDETYPLEGALAEVWLADKAWSAAQVRQLYTNGRDHYPEDAVAVGVAPWKGVRELGAQRVGDASAVRVPTAQWVQPAGVSFAYPGRPVDLAVSPDGRVAAIKDNTGVGLFDIAPWQPRQFLRFPAGGGSMHGLLFAADGSRLWATTAQSVMYEARRSGNAWHWHREIPLPGPGGSGASHATGIAHDVAGNRLFVCLSRNNSLAEIDLANGNVVREIPVGVAPFDVVLLPGAQRAVVSNWGGRHPRAGELTAPSSGTPVLVDERGIAKSGTVGLVDLKLGRQIRETATGLHPADLVLDVASDRVYVANANSDTVTVLRASTLAEVVTVLVRPDPALPFGSATNALALSPDRLTLYAANGGNNAVAVLRRTAVDSDAWTVVGFVPAAWYPSAVQVQGDALLVANVKGIGSRSDTNTNWRHVKSYTGVVSKVPLPDADQLVLWSDQVRVAARVPIALRQFERQQDAANVSPVPVPARLGQPSVFRHVVYVIKENRTYDQVFGDLPQGNGDPKLCIFPRKVTPNHHKLAETFVLLDNFYCNGVLSADGHSWATEGNVTDHLEKSFGGFTRSYTFGDDPLTYSSSGFLWDHVLLAGLSFRNYGELDYAAPVPANTSFKAIYDDFASGKNGIQFSQNIGIESLRRYSSPDFPGWNMRIPDVLRVDRFLREMRAAEQKGDWYDFMIVFLPQDHTSGLSKGMPTPAAHMADNDLALGRLVEGISNSKFWPETCIFVIEDDPQNGFDHVDGHRSLALVCSPYTRRGAVISDFFNQTSVLHTMERILGLAPMNQMDAASPLMTKCFQADAVLTPYEAEEPGVPLDQLTAAVTPAMRPWFVASSQQDFEGFDRADEDTMNRILWHALRGADAEYPEHLAGAHGKGLGSLKLKLGK